MGKGSTPSTKEHYKRLPNGMKGCYKSGCDKPGTWWADWEHNNCPRFVSTAYCDAHGEQEKNDPTGMTRIRPLHQCAGRLPFHLDREIFKSTLPRRLPSNHST